MLEKIHFNLLNQIFTEKLLCCSVPGKLRQFVLDLHSGKLHREFHHSPDPMQSAVLPTSSEAAFEKETKGTDKSQPPTSIFKQLKPSETRYSLLYKDEL
ncbi:hypothetical protein WUBG_09562 [Wuchereria bancrofti]|uniref:Uncharacterized protein n=1 Tax=Wuchereria bancrofti TaxID=6293 RepID=J9AY91_WUCBA|nr:hypothetical protein WUBG_09562 [Wuchereria bancrofti]